ncbi:putative ribonuclease H-like domain-containing protein [Tanacetum coccineum]
MRVEETLHIGFLGNKPMIEGNGLKWLFDIDSLTQSMNYVPIAAGTISNESASTQEEFNAGTSTQKEEISQDCIVKDGPHNESDEKDKSDDDSSPKEVNTIGQHVNTASPKVNTGRFKLNTVDPSVNTASSSDPDSPKDMFTMGPSHTLEPEVDLGNIPNSYTVPTTPNTRIHKDHPIKNVIGDIKPTSIAKALSDSSWVEVMQEELLNKKDERWIVIRNKERLVAQGHRQEEGIDYEDVFALVARIEAIRLFFVYASFMVFLVYLMDVKSAFLYGTIEEEKEDGIFISRDKYVAEILKKFNYTNVKYASTLVDLEKPLVKDGDVDDVDVHLYRSMIRYLKGKPSLGLWYYRDSPFELVAYTDSDYAGATQDRKSTTRGCQFLGNRLISWLCKKQIVVAISTTNVEYVAAASCCGQIFLHKVLMLEGFSTWSQVLECLILNVYISLYLCKGLVLHVKRDRDTKIPQSSGPPVKVGDEAVHKELDD